MFENLCIIKAARIAANPVYTGQLGFVSVCAASGRTVRNCPPCRYAETVIQMGHVFPRVVGNAGSLRMSGGSSQEEKSESRSNPTVIFESESSIRQQKAQNNNPNSVWLKIFSGFLAVGTLTAMFYVIKNAAAGNMYASGLSAGLASSSCCLFQLMLNGLSALGGLLNVGCAGFNKTLGPWRTFFRSITAGWLVILWFMGLKNAWPKLQLIITSIITMGLSFLPEIITALGKRSSAKTLPGREIAMKIEGMGCEACQAHVQATIEAAPGVVA
eukprot:CAMPEP_0172158500 /NCGR_PEP_ID=MMETSP1050-20130122/4409_1 /TAXON_ID=233186 /ORGANISM="Cryptomonas curvata, Strain CCAP979/52" /LENGTH=271 /DNA_ID=CAMNT_0012827903 /DNA_START=1 /DNA_END=813 /DNA_ORIENTATION=+